MSQKPTRTSSAPRWRRSSTNSSWSGPTSSCSGLRRLPGPGRRPAWREPSTSGRCSWPVFLICGSPSRSWSQKPTTWQGAGPMRASTRESCWASRLPASRSVSAASALSGSREAICRAVRAARPAGPAAATRRAADARTADNTPKVLLTALRAQPSVLPPCDRSASPDGLHWRWSANVWWAREELNLRPLPCQRGAAPSRSNATLRPASRHRRWLVLSAMELWCTAGLRDTRLLANLWHAREGTTRSVWPPRRPPGVPGSRWRVPPRWRRTRFLP
jgi:hypothetical protein